MTDAQNIYRKIAHDFLNITSRLESATSLIPQGEAVSEDDIRMVSSIFCEGSQKLAGAIQLFCWWQWLEHAPDLALTPCDLAFILQEEIAAQAELHPTVNYAITPLKKTEIMADRSLMQMFIREVIRNAAQHNKNPNPVTISLTSEGPYYKLVVQNTINTPLPQHFKDALGRTTHSPGLGFGFSFLQSAAKALGVSFDVTHNENTFTVQALIPKK